MSFVVDLKIAKFFRKNRKKLPQVQDALTTIDHILKTHPSVTRFGDGEFDLIHGLDIKFQKATPDLSDRLAQVLNSPQNDSLLVCVPSTFDQTGYRHLTTASKEYWFTYLNNRIDKIVIPKNKLYYDANFTRFHLRNRDRTYSQKLIGGIKQIWKDRNIVIIEGAKSRLGLGNDLFHNTTNVRRILCPTSNAFSKYPEILGTAKTYPRNTLFLISLGPTATLLSYDLHHAGYQALDIGHIDQEYEWFISGNSSRTPIKNKVVTELGQSESDAPDHITDTKYLSEIDSEIS
ncbi:GT-D fold domain-containing glycosyltransferase [Candidatus Saccharibacteria bacterium]|nr:GT-D fold domain-containing glycosyltransferase [Candidatus Saccharibacteria bacterium]